MNHILLNYFLFRVIGHYYILSQIDGMSERKQKCLNCRRKKKHVVACQRLLIYLVLHSLYGMSYCVFVRPWNKNKETNNEPYSIKLIFMCYWFLILIGWCCGKGLLDNEACVVFCQLAFAMGNVGPMEFVFLLSND